MSTVFIIIKTHKQIKESHVLIDNNSIEEPKN